MKYPAIQHKPTGRKAFAIPKLKALSAVAIVCAIATIALATPAEASVFNAHVVNNRGYSGVNVRTGPGTSFPVVRTIAAGAPVGINCFAPGTKVTGPYGASNLWDRLDDGRWVADALIYTGRNSSVVPPCTAPSSDGRKRGKAANRNLAYSPKECTWLALERAKAYSGDYPLTSGDARNWYASAGANGWSTSLDAQPNSIVVFQPGTYGAHSTGHVGWVTSVEHRSDGTYIHMDDRNYDGRGSNRTNVVLKDVRGMSYVLMPAK